MPLVALDSSCVVAWLLMDESVSPQATGMRRDIEAHRLDCVVAAPFGFELRNALVGAARARRVPWESLPDQLGSIGRLRIKPVPSSADSRLIALAREFGLGWADAHWVDLALRLAIPLVTADQRLVRALRGSPVWVEWLGDRPLDSV